MSQYYYTRAALPTIRLGEKVPISGEKFLQFAGATVSPGDYRLLSRSRWGSDDPAGHSFADRILAWDKELRLELARARLAEPKCSLAELVLPESDGLDVLTEKVRTALTLDSPLAVEIYLNNLRWGFVEEMGVAHFFDLEAMMAYYLKLQIALRQEKFQKEVGLEFFKKYYRKVVEKVDI